MEDSRYSIKDSTDSSSESSCPDSISYLQNMVFNLESRLNEAIGAINVMKVQIADLQNQNASIQERLEELHIFVEEVSSIADDALSKACDLK